MSLSKYEQIIQHIFERNYRPGDVVVPFARGELVAASVALGIGRIKNLGDIPYAFRFRRPLPAAIQASAPPGAEWIIVGMGIAAYAFRLAAPGKIAPSAHAYPLTIPDATPEIIRYYAPGTDEQALLTRARYNRLVDLFTGLTCYSVQNHLRTVVAAIGQIEIDEIYVGLNRRGVHFVLPCQAKSPGDRIGIVQVIQDIAFCNERYPQAICRPIGLQFTGSDTVAMLELAVREEDQILKLNTVDEKHYQLVMKSTLSNTEIRALKDREAGADYHI